MMPEQSDITTTLFMLPPDAKFLRVAELSPRLRAKIGPVEDGQSVITRPGFRVTTRLAPRPLADLLAEFRAPRLLTDAVFRFAQAHEQDPLEVMDLAFDSLATLIEARILVPDGSPDASAPAPTLAAGQAFAGFEIESLVRSLDDSEVYRAHRDDAEPVALKIARDDRPWVNAIIANEARVLAQLDGVDSPRLVQDGTERGRAFVAMEWCDGLSIAFAAQQARASGDRRRLRGLVGRFLDAYGRLHNQGVLHGDIHPGNCLVRDDGRIVILDFGNARPTQAASTVDAGRAGIPQFYDPEMAAALLARQLPPAATPASEQYAIAALAYLLLTGLMPIDAPAVHDELLRRIVERPALPFATRGVASWPDIEAIVGRGLMREPADRFADVASMARAFASAEAEPDAPPRWCEDVQSAFDAAVQEVRDLAPSTQPAQSWFALRAALALEDAELLAAADVLASSPGSSWAGPSIAAHVARARSDTRMESQAMAAFVTAVERLGDREAAAAIVAAAGMLDGGMSRAPEAATLAGWAARRLDGLLSASSSIADPQLVYAALSLVKAGVITAPPDLSSQLEILYKRRAGHLWLWALAYDVFADVRFRARALAARRPAGALKRGLACLRLHQLTGDAKWVGEARRVVENASGARVPARDIALLVAELVAPERAALPPYVCLSKGA
jgi:hypothetical protein